MKSNRIDINASIGFNCVGKELIAIHPSDEHFLWATGKTVKTRGSSRIRL